MSRSSDSHPSGKNAAPFRIGRVRNKPGLGWRVKTRNERYVPLIPALAEMLRIFTRNRRTGPVFQQQRCASGHVPPLATSSPIELEREVDRRLLSSVGDRKAAATMAKTIWRDIGALKEDRLRKEYMRITKDIGMPEFTALKTLRHTFATCLQDANVDLLIRNELMGYAPGHTGSGGREGIRLLPPSFRVFLTAFEEELQRNSPNNVQREIQACIDQWIQEIRSHCDSPKK